MPSKHQVKTTICEENGELFTRFRSIFVSIVHGAAHRTWLIRGIGKTVMHKELRKSCLVERDNHGCLLVQMSVWEMIVSTC